MADNNTVARPYAKAAFDVARAEGALDELSTALAAAKELLADGQVSAFLANPSLNDEQRLTFLQSLFADAPGGASALAGGSRHGTNFLKLLLEYGRLGTLPEISDHFDRLKAQVENTVEVTITSAAQLGGGERERIVAALKARFGREVNVATEIDETLIGGAVIRAGDVVIDGSLRSRLEGLANALTA
ncbi:MAG: F0F1 ATP synthase subunit delta [Pseudomonadota bacterium]